jgi:hypothetical protein
MNVFNTKILYFFSFLLEKLKHSSDTILEKARHSFGT